MFVEMCDYERATSDLQPVSRWLVLDPATLNGTAWGTLVVATQKLAAATTSAATVMAIATGSYGHNSERSPVNN